MKFLIFDAGPIISLAMNGLLPVIEKLKENFNGEFIITPQVKEEVVDRPYKIRKFKLEAIKVQNLIEKGTLKLSSDFVPNLKLNNEVMSILKKLNGSIRSIKTKEKVSIIHAGEASCLAFANLCGKENLIIIDERTTRILFESTDSLEKLMEMKLHSELDVDLGVIKKIGNFRFIRSAELVFVAYQRDLTGLGKGKEILDGLLYALKVKGATISSRDINYLKSIA